jgi:hypothetical protein
MTVSFSGITRPVPAAVFDLPRADQIPLVAAEPQQHLVVDGFRAGLFRQPARLITFHDCRRDLHDQLPAEVVRYAESACS